MMWVHDVEHVWDDVQHVCASYHIWLHNTMNMQDAEDSGVLNVNAAHGCLNLVLRDEGLMRFVKYVSSAAPSSRWDVAMEYKPEDDSDEEEGGGEKGD